MTRELPDRYDLYCDGCGTWLTFTTDNDNPTCPTCRTCRWLDDNEPRGRMPTWAGEDGPDYGGAFDGFTVTSDADPGL